MKAVEFDEVNVRIAEDQEEYQTLPAHKKVGVNGEMIMRFKLSKEEREQVREEGEIWLKILTFGKPLQPIGMDLLDPFKEVRDLLYYERMKLAVSSYEEFEKWVMEAKPNELYRMPEELRFQYESVKIDKNTHDIEDGEYSWSLSRNYAVLGSVGYVFPLKNSNYVQSFKTEKGAKRNLLKQIKWIFDKRDND